MCESSLEDFGRASFRSIFESIECLNLAYSSRIPESWFEDLRVAQDDTTSPWKEGLEALRQGEIDFREDAKKKLAEAKEEVDDEAESGDRFRCR